MEYSREELLTDFNLFVEDMNKIDSTNSNLIIDFCIKIESYLFEHNYICRHYYIYKNDWSTFEKNMNRNTNEKTLYELLVYLTIYSREEREHGNYGNYYLRGFQNGTIPDIIRGITDKLQKMSAVEKEMEDNISQIDISGEYFVAAELSRRGYITSLKSKRSNKIDILMPDKTGKRISVIKVIASNDPEQFSWKLNKSAEENFDFNLFYVFVNLNSGKEPFYYIVPSIYVAYRTKVIYDEWVKSLDNKEKRKKKTKDRIFEFTDKNERAQYQNAWNLIGI